MSVTLHNIVVELKSSPCSIQTLATRVGKDRRTVRSLLTSLESSGLVKARKGHAHIYSLLHPNNFFHLPVKPEHEALITSLYAQIRLYANNPSSLQVHKTLYVINAKLRLGLPIGWYQYGPLCVQAYQGDEQASTNFTPTQLRVIKEATKTYCSVNGLAAMKQLYEDEQNTLYLAKEELFSIKSADKVKVQAIFLKLLKTAPKQTIDVITDFARAALLLGYERMQGYVGLLWKYVSAVQFKETLTYYDEQTKTFYLDSFIEQARNNIQVIIQQIVSEHVNIPSQEKRRE